MDEDDTEGRAKSPSIVSASGMRRKPSPVDIYAKTPLDIYATNPSWQSATSGTSASKPSVPDERKNSTDLEKLDELIQSLSEL